MRYFLTPLLVLLLSACQLTQPSAPLKTGTSKTRSVTSYQQACGPPLGIVVRGGTMAFYGEQSTYWPEQFTLCDGQSKKITFYEMRQGTKHPDYAKTITVALIDGLLIFDANPYQPLIVNHGAHIPLNYSSTQRISNLSLMDNFSISKARNISIIIKQPQQGTSY